MPYFVDNGTERRALVYFTLMVLCNHSLRCVRSTYPLVRDDPNWQSSVAQAFSRSVDDVRNAMTDVEAAFALLKADDFVVQRGEYLFPKRLSMVETAPEFLFLRGEVSLLDDPIVSVVGTRHPSEHGSNRAGDLARRLSERHVTVASGLALGIDRAAHQGALEVMGKTVAVIGTPLTKAYPRENTQLQDYISTVGLLVSQFLPGTSVFKWNFPPSKCHHERDLHRHDCC